MKNVTIRNTSPSLGRLFKERGRCIHISKRLQVVENPITKKPMTIVSPFKGSTLDLNRNKVKMMNRELNGVRK